jgi:hypothetical protein
METLYVTNGGHDHKGYNEDGSAQQIDLTDMVTGKLPMGNMQKIALDSTGITGMLTSAHVTGVITDVSWAVGVTGPLTVLDTKIFKQLAVSYNNGPGDPAPVTSTIYSLRGATYPGGWYCNSTVTKPDYAVNGGFAVCQASMPTNGSIEVTQLGWPMSSPTNCFMVDLLFRVVGVTYPYVIRGAFNRDLIDAMTNKKVYAVRADSIYSAGNKKANYDFSPDADVTIPTANIYLEKTGSVINLVNGTSAAVYMTGTCTVTQ